MAGSIRRADQTFPHNLQAFQLSSDRLMEEQDYDRRKTRDAAVPNLKLNVDSEKVNSVALVRIARERLRLPIRHPCTSSALLKYREGCDIETTEQILDAKQLSPAGRELLWAENVLKNELLLHEAVIKNDAEAVRRALKDPLNIDSRNNYGRAPIHWAASRGNIEIMEMLIAAKCDIEAKDKYGMRPIMMAAWHGRKGAVEMLINCGASVVAVNRKQYTLLMCAARNNQLEVLNFLLDTLEDINLDATDADHQTALFHAAHAGHTDVVKRLIQARAKIDVRNKQGWTPLHAAAEKGHVDMLDLLLRHNVDMSARDEDGNSALHTATENQQTTIVQLLLQRGHSTDPANKKGFTPLHIACSLGSRGIIDLLIQHNSTINCQSENGNTPLHVACQRNNKDIAELLIGRGADVNLLNARLQSPMHIAAEQGQVEICKILLNARVNIDQKEQAGRTPLYIAARGSFTTIVDMIIKTARVDTAKPDEELEPIVRFNRKCRMNCDGQVDRESFQKLLWRVAYKQLRQGEWKRLALHWTFTDDQIRAIEHQYTGQSSYKEHGYRMLLIWAQGLGPQVNPVKELHESLAAIGKTSVADSIKKKVDEEREGRYNKNDRGKCHSCSLV
ncbi:ankyrin repeat and death domain-containing protein 1A-like [Anabrus simplex]|uniref:ankyrin repeat and death domain-containing protein 1A-like n=1 Tax=Anabrus simplex TaxID=316456 RepID=UPI0035A2BD49